MNTEQQIEFDKIKELWSALAITKDAKEKIAGAGVILNELELRKQLRDTTNAREMIEKLGAPPLQNVTEILEIMTIAERGECLTPYQLERVEKVLVVVERLKLYLSHGKQFGNPLAYYDENLDEQKELREEICRQIRNEAVDDRASRTLQDVRARIQRCVEEMKQKAEQIIRGNKECMADTYYTMRNGRVCVPVKKEYKFRIPGSVVDRSSTGSTLFIEPVGVAKLFEELQLLRIEEEDEVYKILYTLTAMVSDAIPFMTENMKMIEKLDFIFSKGKLSIDLVCTEPAINLDRRVVLKAARHPLMDKAVNIPLDFTLGTLVSGQDRARDNEQADGRSVEQADGRSNERADGRSDEQADGRSNERADGRSDEQADGRSNERADGRSVEQADDRKCAGIRGIVITGPNTGGKTVAIKTVMLNSYMAQCGLHVTCEEADLCMNANYLCDIGDGQNLSENLSTFSAHIKNVLEILKQVNSDSLVIMDELGSGTDPAEGMGIAVAILEELKKSGANFLVTTHYPEIKEYAARTEGIVNARMTFDRETLMPTYKMVIGEAGESCAFYIADRLGMPEHMLQVAARAAYGEEAARDYQFHNKEGIRKASGGKIAKEKKSHVDKTLGAKFQIGDSVMVYPDKKIGIVCEPVNDKGVLRVQVADRKIWINHKRVKLHVKAEELYPEDYDFSIIFDSVENRKARHDMERKYTEEIIVREKDS